MSWAIKSRGSWGEATSSNPAGDFPAALALPGSWLWYPAATTLLVRKDQWGQLAAIPEVDSITPNNGPVAGGTGVTIAGSGLIGSTGVTFGGTAATGFLVPGDGTITCITPAHAAGGVAVVVLNPRGNVNLANGFTYA
jgi:hypothetical protein